MLLNREESLIPKSQQLKLQSWPTLVIWVGWACTLMILLHHLADWGIANWRWIATAAVCIGLGGLFVWQERRDALLDYKFIYPTEVRTLFVMRFLLAGMIFGSLMIIPLYLLNAQGLSISMVSVALMTLTLTNGLTAYLGTILSQRLGYRWVIFLASLFGLVGFYTIQLLQTIDEWALLSLACLGIQFGLMRSTTQWALVEKMTAQGASLQSAMVYTWTLLGGAAGVALFGVGYQMRANSVFEIGIPKTLVHFVQTHPKALALILDGAHPLTDLDRTVPAAIQPALYQAIRISLHTAFTTLMQVAMVITLLILVMAVRVRRKECD